jgi:D-alanyl-D-alanine carboxypeptidase/D-alanyl-D-alanine-endopeptidase (penicillin-binding protein 4)
MKRSFSLLAAGLLLSGCAATSRLAPPTSPLAYLSTARDADFKQGIDTLLADSLFIKIVSAESGQTLYELNPEMLFNPASNEKLVTSSTALRRLGQKFRLRTAVLADSARRVLWIQGFGDPLLSSNDLDSLASAVSGTIDSATTWQLKANVTYFDDLSWGAGWAWDEEPAAYGMFISPLILDNNTILVTVLPGEKAGDPPEVSTFPRTRFVSIENSAITVADTPIVSELQVSRKWRERSNVITVSGKILLSSRPRKETLSVWKPELYAATVFSEKLQARGVRVDSVTIDTSQVSGTPLTEYVHTLDTAITFMNKVSDNLSAEALLKTVAAESLGTPGSAEAGAFLARETLAHFGVDTNRIVIVDGSGLSRYDLLSPSALVRLLEGMAQDTLNFPVFYQSLPIAGVDGTLNHRMQNTPAQGNLHAKTGSLSGVSTLSGYVRTAGGHPLIFSMMMQNFPGSARTYRGVQDRIGEFLARWK